MHNIFRINSCNQIVLLIFISLLLIILAHPQDPCIYICMTPSITPILLRQKTPKYTLIALTLLGYRTAKYILIALNLPDHKTSKCTFICITPPIASTLLSCRTLVQQLMGMTHSSIYLPILILPFFFSYSVIHTFCYYHILSNHSVYPSTLYKHPKKFFFKQNQKKNFFSLSITFSLKNLLFLFIFFRIRKFEKNFYFLLLVLLLNFLINLVYSSWV